MCASPPFKNCRLLCNFWHNLINGSFWSPCVTRIIEKNCNMQLIRGTDGDLSKSDKGSMRRANFTNTYRWTTPPLPLRSFLHCWMEKGSGEGTYDWSVYEQQKWNPCSSKVKLSTVCGGESCIGELPEKSGSWPVSMMDCPLSSFPWAFRLGLPPEFIPPSAFSSLFPTSSCSPPLSPVLHSILQSSALQLPLWSHWFVKISTAAVEIGLQS